jgi:hypothetical protein
MNNFPFKKAVIAISIFAMSPLMVNAAEIFDPNEQLKHGKEMVDSSNFKEKRKLDLEIAILNNEIKNLDGTNQKTIDEAVAKASADIEKKYLLQIKMLENQVNELSAKNKSLSGDLGSGDHVDEVFFTGIIEIGSSKKAEVIAGGSRSLVTVGQQIMPGMTVTSIESNRLIVKTNNGSRSFPLKSSAQIADKLYESAMDKVRSQKSRDGGQAKQATRLPDDFKIGDDLPSVRD